MVMQILGEFITIAYLHLRRPRISIKVFILVLVIVVCVVNFLWSNSRESTFHYSKHALVRADNKVRPSSFARKYRPGMIHSKAQTIPIYYVNLDAAKERRKYIETHLGKRHLKAVRVPAVETISHVNISVLSPLSKGEPNDKEIACLASHMTAIHTAVNDKSFFPNSPYAIIIEDDVAFEFPINWNELLYSAPQEFDVLQLMTSNLEQVVQLADYYSKAIASNETVHEEVSIHPDDTKHELLWHLRERGSNLWSTQAYAINKNRVRSIINDLVKLDNATGKHYVTLKNTAAQVAHCVPVNTKACRTLYSFRLVADIYLYDLLGTAYTLRLPLLNGASGLGSSVSEKDASIFFKSISDVVTNVRGNSKDLLPAGLLL